MPGRDLMVRIRADITDFQNKVRLAQSQVGQFDKNMQSGSTKSGKALTALGVTYRGVGLAAVAGAGAAVKAFADFDAQMSSVQATGRDAERNIDALRRAALEAGNDTAFSAGQAAAGVESLLKAGISAADVMGGGLDGALALAASGNLDVAGSAEAAAAAMSQFALTGEDVPHIADLLAAGAGKANGEVSDMAQALNQAGLVAAGAGANIEETTGTLAAFAKSGLLGSDAGTSLKTALQRLQAPTAENKRLMSQLNISAYDTNGNFVGLASIADQLREAFKGQSDEARSAALATIFGADAVRAANVLYKEGGDGIRDWTKAVDDAGFAAEVAATKQDNLKGDLEKLKGTVDTLFISGGSKGDSPLRGLVQSIDDAIKGIAKLNDAWNRNVADKFTAPKTDSKGIFGSFKEIWQASGIAGKTGVPESVVLKFKTEGAPKAASDAAKVARAANLTPKQVRSVLRLMGWSTKGIDPVIRRMQAVERKQFVARLRLLNPQLTEKQIQAIVKKMDEAGKPRKPTKVNVDNKQALSNLSAVQRELLGIKSKDITVTTHYETTGTPPGGFTGGLIAELPGFAGGRVPGTPPSDPRQDNVLAQDEYGGFLRVRSREFIVNEPASRLNDRLLRAINSGADFSRWPGYADGRVGGSLREGAAASDMRILSGNVTINGLDARMEIIAQDVVDGNASHAASRARANVR